MNNSVSKIIQLVIPSMDFNTRSGGMKTMFNIPYPYVLGSVTKSNHK